MINREPLEGDPNSAHEPQELGSVDARPLLTPVLDDQDVAFAVGEVQARPSATSTWGMSGEKPSIDVETDSNRGP